MIAPDDLYAEAKRQCQRKTPLRRQSRAMTLLELMLVIGIIVLLLALLIPAVQYARESARRMHCGSNLRQLGLAISNYEAAHNMLPPGTSSARSLFFNLLPYLERSDLAERVDHNDIFHGADFLDSVVIPYYVCPSDSVPGLVPHRDYQFAGTNYAACSGSWVNDNPGFVFNGMFRVLEDCPPFVCGPVTTEQVTDGLSQTAALSEILRSDGSGSRLRVTWELAESFGPGQQEAFAANCRVLPAVPQSEGWIGNMFGRGIPWHRGGDFSATFYNPVLLPNNPSCLNKNTVPSAASTAGSQHPNGVSLLFGDGRVEFISETIDFELWRSMASRNDGQ